MQSSDKPGTAAGSAEASTSGHNGRAPSPFDKRPTKLTEDSKYGSPEVASTISGFYAAEHGKARGKLTQGKGGYDAMAELGSVSLADAAATGLIDRSHRPSQAEVARWHADRGCKWEPETPASVQRAGLSAAIKGLDAKRTIALTTIDAVAAEGVAWAVTAAEKAAADNLDAAVKVKAHSFTLTELFHSHGAPVGDLVALPPMTAETRLASLRLLREWAAAENLRAQDSARKRLAASATVIELPPVTGLADLLDAPDDPVRFRIECVWPAGGAKVLCAAPAGGGKTTLSGNLVRSLADGDPFLDVFAVAQRAERIVVIDNEMTQGMLKRWLRRQGVANTAAVVDVVNLRGQAGLFDLGNDRLRDMWVRRLADLGCDFVVFDCLKPVLEAMGLDENREMGKLLYPLTDMLTAAGVDDVLVHHHMGHANERARGDSTLLGWSDANWKIVRDDEHPLQPRYFSTDKVRDADEPVREGLLTFDKATGRLAYAGGNRATTHQAENVEKRLAAVLDVLADKATEGKDELNATEIKTAVGGRRETTDEALALAEKRGLVTRRHQGRAKLYRLDPKARDPLYTGDDSDAYEGTAPGLGPRAPRV